MLSNEKLVEFIKADWEAKKRAFDAAVSSPFNQIGFLIGPQNELSSEQYILIPQTPSSYPLKTDTLPK
ncbi:MAG: hypothetical protein ACHQ03_10960 [Candidatus Bathyarchaeia archaeon]